MHWLQTEEDGSYSLQSLQLDIVGFLAILGEGSVLANAQVSTLSKWIFLPRLIPAPQAMMRPSRPLELEPVKGDVSGVWSGNDRGNINFIGNVICDANNLPRHSVRLVTVTRKPNSEAIKAKAFGPLTYVAWLGFTLSVMLLGLSIHLRDGMSIISVILLSFLSTLIGLGNFCTLKLSQRKNKKQLSAAAREKIHASKEAVKHPGKSGDKKSVESSDGNIEGGCDIAAAEQGDLPPKSEDHVPPGDVVIRYPKGNFLIVRCHEDVARELYFAPEEIHYLIEDAWIYRLLSLVGTMMLMGGVICLANARIESQIAWAGSYMLLGAAYWIVAALPPKVHWDTSSYNVELGALSDSVEHTKSNILSRSRRYPYSKSETFTIALWKAIVASQDTTWVRRNNHCPATEAWDEWLADAKSCLTDFRKPMTEAEKNQNTREPKFNDLDIWRIPPWDPVENLQRVLKAHQEKNARKRD